MPTRYAGGRSTPDFAQHLIHAARNLHADDGLPSLDLGNTVYALDSSTIDLCRDFETAVCLDPHEDEPIDDCHYLYVSTSRPKHPSGV